MSVKVDQDLCTGCGICIDACPEVFNAQEEGKAQVIKDTCETCDLEEIANQCPVNAIEIA